MGKCSDSCVDEQGLNRLLDTVRDDWQFGNNTGYSSVHVGCYETDPSENVAWPPTAMELYRKQCELNRRLRVHAPVRHVKQSCEPKRLIVDDWLINVASSRSSFTTRADSERAPCRALKVFLLLNFDLEVVRISDVGTADSKICLRNKL